MLITNLTLAWKHDPCFTVRNPEIDPCLQKGSRIETNWCVFMSETCFRIRYPPYAGPLHLTDFQHTTLALGLCIRSYGLAQAIFTVTWHLERNCSSSRNTEADNIGPFVVLCIIVFLQNCTVALRYNNAALSKIFHYMCNCACAHMRLFAAHWCVAALQYVMCTHRYIATSTLLVYCFLHVLPYVSVCQRHIFLELDFYGYACIAIGISTQDIDCINKHEEKLLPHFILKPLILSPCCASF